MSIVPPVSLNNIQPIITVDPTQNTVFVSTITNEVIVGSTIGGGGGGSGTVTIGEVDINNQTSIDVTHNLNRYPIIEVFLLKSGAFGLGGMGFFGFGAAGTDAREVANSALYDILHIDKTKFTITFNGTFEGEIVYI